ncbi:MAG: DNA-directed RNA polymerase subunit alpha C-terminal domain-containing protein [Patescibacteria group bacterium]
MPARLCNICQLDLAHPLYGGACENCYANAQSYLTRPYDDYDFCMNESKIKDAPIKQILDAPVSMLKLSIKIENCLFDHHIHLIKDLIAKTKEDIIKIRTFGEATVAEIEKKLQNIGLALRGSQLQES